MRVGVIGAGFVGSSTALHLLRRGHRVTLLDASTQAGSPAAASFGNAGLFVPGFCVPIQAPSLPLRLPELLLRSDGPVAFARPLSETMRWITQPATVGWLLRFLSNCRPSKVEATTVALAALLQGAEQGYQIPFDCLSASDRVRAFGPDEGNAGCLWLSDTKRQADADADARRKHGVKVDVLDAVALAAMEPISVSDGMHGAFFPDAWHLASPGALVQALAHGVARDAHGELQVGTRAVSIAEREAGGVEVEVEVEHIACTEDFLVRNKRHRLQFDQVVVACGARSGTLAATLGDSIPLDTERGYHLTFEWRGTDCGDEPSQRLTRAVGHSDLGFFVTPMRCPASGALQIRVAGTVELGGLHAPPNPER